MMLRHMPLLAKRGRPPSALLVLRPSRSPATINSQHCLAGSLSSLSPSVPLLLQRHSTTAPTTSIPVVTSTSTTTPDQPSLASSRSACIVDFSNTEVAYATLSTMDLIRAYLVFKACAIKPLVTHADQILQISYRILGKSLIEGIVRRTFFRHFCAGETSQMIRPRIAKLKEGGVAGILDYAAEADIKEMMTSPAVEATTQAYKEGEIACRVYEYESERTCDAHVQTFLECIHAVKDVTPEGFAAIKVTALGNPQLLERMSVCVVEMGKLFKKFDTQDKGYITRQEFLEGYDTYFLPSSSSPSSSSAPSPDAAAPAVADGKDDDLAAQLLARLDPGRTDRIDIIHWRIALALTDLSALTRLCRGAGPLKAAVLSEEETELMQGLQLRLETLARRASSLGVRLMIDAEQSYFQPAIDHLVLDLMQRHNRGKFVVYTTVQCYLKGAQRRIVREMERAQRQDYYFAAKLVRGAYMITEKKRAEERGYPSPIHETIEDTHATYDGCVQLCLEAMARGENVELLIASHNQASIEKALVEMERLNLKGNTAGVYFGQLLGMADHLTLTLGGAGYKAYKYVPYGLVGQVLPYLIRRAQENSDMLGGVGLEIELVGKELRRRLLG